MDLLNINMENITSELDKLMQGAPFVGQEHVNRDQKGFYTLTRRNSDYVELRNTELDHHSFASVLSGNYSTNPKLHDKKPNFQPLNQNLRLMNKAYVSSFELNKTAHVKPGEYYQYGRRASAADAEQRSSLINSAISNDDVSDSLLPSDLPHLKLNTDTRHSSRRKLHRNRVPVVANTNVNYDNVVIDLHAIGLSIENKENDVLRLFGLLRKLHHFLNDVVPFQPEPDLSDYPNKFEKPVSSMLCTMNVKAQIKHVVYKCNNFCLRMLEKLDEFKYADHEKYYECNRSVQILRRIVKQLEFFKTVDLEHKKGAFVDSFAEAQAKNLELLLNQIIAKVRECNIYIEVYRWNIRMSIQQTGMRSMKTLEKAVAIASATYQEQPSKFTLDAVESVQRNREEEVYNHNAIYGGAVDDGFLPPPPQIAARKIRLNGI